MFSAKFKKENHTKITKKLNEIEFSRSDPLIPNLFQFDSKIKNNPTVQCCFTFTYIFYLYFFSNKHCVNTKRATVTLHSDYPTSLNIHRFPESEETLWTTSHIQRGGGGGRGGELAHGYQGVSTPCWLWLHDCPHVDPPTHPPNSLLPILLLHTTAAP